MTGAAVENNLNRPALNAERRVCDIPRGGATRAIRLWISSIVIRMRLFSLLNSIIFSFAMLILAFAVLKWLHVPAGTFGDWIGGLLSFFWLTAVVTVPWNIHFKARAVLADAQPSRERGLPVDERQVAYVRKLVRTSLLIAIALHLLSALVLFVLAFAGLARMGYIASVVALLLTALRPSMSAYEYLAERLRAIGQDWKYPIQDVMELRSRVDTAESTLKGIQRQLDPENPESLVMVERTHAEDSRREVANVTASVESLRAGNENDHKRLSEEARSAISQITTDGQFLEHVREILRFFKSA